MAITDTSSTALGGAGRRGLVAANVNTWLALLVCAMTLATFAPALTNGFVTFDDDRNFLTNSHYRGLGWHHLRWMFTTTHMGQYIPLTWITLGLDYLVWGMNPLGYHLTSVLLHASAALALYFVALRLLAIVTGRAGDWRIAVGAAVAALLFAIHPLRVESVAWATERRDVLSGLFYLLTVLAWLRWVQHEEGRRRWYWAAVALFACAVFSKALAVTLAATLLVLDVYPLKRLGRHTGWWTPAAARIYAEKLPFFVIAAAGSIMAFRAMASIRNLTSLESLGLIDRLAVSGFSVAFYVWKAIVPVDLSPLYQLPAVVKPADYTASFIIVGLAAIVAVLERRRAPWFAAACVAYLITILPVLGLFQNGLQIAADRYTYLAGIPWAILIGGGATVLLRRVARHGREAQLATAIAGVLVMIIFQLATVSQIRVWRDGITLWRHAVEVDPSSAVAYNNLGAALLGVGRIDEAAGVLEQAVKRLPGLPSYGRANTVQALGVLHQHRGNLQRAERLYREALAIDGYHTDAWNNLGTVLAMQKKVPEALDAFRRVLTIQPGNPHACANARRAGEMLRTDVHELRTCSNSLRN